MFVSSLLGNLAGKHKQVSPAALLGQHEMCFMLASQAVYACNLWQTTTLQAVMVARTARQTITWYPRRCNRQAALTSSQCP